VLSQQFPFRLIEQIMPNALGNADLFRSPARRGRRDEKMLEE